MNIDVYDAIDVVELLLYNTVAAALADDLYITKTELRTDPYSIPIEEVDNKYLSILQAVTKKMIDDKCKQVFLQEGSTLEYIEKKMDGSGKSVQFIDVPVYQRLLAVQKVRIYNSNTSYLDYTAENFTVRPTYIEWNIYSRAYEEIRRTFQVDMFSEGMKNIGIFGIWGWAEIPEEIKFVQGRLIAKFLKEGSFVQRFQSENAGDYSYTIKTIQDEIFGDPEIDMIIKMYTAWSVYAI